LCPPRGPTASPEWACPIVWEPLHYIMKTDVLIQVTVSSSVIKMPLKKERKEIQPLLIPLTLQNIILYIPLYTSYSTTLYGSNNFFMYCKISLNILS
jgi:hypothetical protein